MEPITFKYRLVNANGNETGFFSSHGVLDEEELLLDKVPIPLACIYRTVHRYNRVAVVYAGANGAATATLAVQGGLDRKLKEAIDRLCAYRWAEARHQQLIQAGCGAAFRTAKCHLCTAVVDLSGFADTPQVYCPFCENILQADVHGETPNSLYRLCDKCRYYCQPTEFTAVYIILNVYSWRKHLSCHVCMRRECWWMLFGNLLPPFIGTFFSVAHTIRAYAGGSMDPLFPELVRANAYSQRGRMEEARVLYEAMLERVRVHAGLRYNLALAYAGVGEWDQCLDAAEAALRDCSNYQPAGNLVFQALTNTGRADEADQFTKSWGNPAVSPAPLLPPAGGSEQIQTDARESGSNAIRRAETGE